MSLRLFFILLVTDVFLPFFFFGTLKVTSHTVGTDLFNFFRYNAIRLFNVGYQSTTQGGVVGSS